MNAPSPPPGWPPPMPEGLIVRDARPDDNDALIALELATPLVLGNEELMFDRSPDFFARHRLQPERRIIVAEMDGEIVAVEAAAIHTLRMNGELRRMNYINHSRVRPDAQRHGVAAAMSSELLTWGRDRGAEGPYWYISPDNEKSIRFGGRRGGRWPFDAVFRSFDVSGADAPPAAPLDAARIDEAVALVNATHDGDELFEPLTSASFRVRLSADTGQYGLVHLRGVVAGGQLVAVAGLWDRGACIEEVRRNSVSGTVSKARAAAVIDWGWARGEEAAFAELLACLAAEARAIGRSGLVISEPEEGAVPDPGLPSHAWALSLFTPNVAAPKPGASYRMFVDLVYL